MKVIADIYISYLVDVDETDYFHEDDERTPAILAESLNSDSESHAFIPGDHDYGPVHSLDFSWRAPDEWDLY